MPTPLIWPLIPVVPAPPAGETPLSFAAAAYARQLKELLPPGSLFLVGADSWLSKALLAIATELARIDQRGLDLLEEADPRTTTELLGEWERMLGLPDGSLPHLLLATADRRLAIAQKYTARGGQSRAFFIGRATALEVVSTINEFTDRVLRAGFRVGDRCYGTAWDHTWELDASDRLATPVIAQVLFSAAVGGALVPGRYTYRVSAVNGFGETLASLELGADAPAGTNTNIMEIIWRAVPGAVSYNVYGRKQGVEWKIAAVAGPAVSYLDDGTIAPAGVLPIANTTGSGALNNVELPPPVIASVGGFVGSSGFGTIHNGVTVAYRVSALNASGETLASAEVAWLVPGVTNTNRVRVTWGAVDGATGYKVYGRTAGAELLLATLGAVTTFTEDGTIVPAGALPAKNTAKTDIALTLEAVVRRAAPAHSIVLFAYP